MDFVAEVLRITGGEKLPVVFDAVGRDTFLNAAANELFEVVAAGKVKIRVNQRFALKDAAQAHRAMEARTTSGATILIP